MEYRLHEKLSGSQLVKKFSAFCGTRRFLPHSQVPATCPCPEPALSSPYPTPHLLKIHLNIILPSTPGSRKCSLSLKFPHQNPVYTSLLPHTRYMPRPSHSPFLSPNNIIIFTWILKLVEEVGNNFRNICILKSQSRVVTRLRGLRPRICSLNPSKGKGYSSPIPPDWLLFHGASYSVGIGDKAAGS